MVLTVVNGEPFRIGQCLRPRWQGLGQQPLDGDPHDEAIGCHPHRLRSGVDGPDGQVKSEDQCGYGGDERRRKIDEVPGGDHLVSQVEPTQGDGGA